MPIYTLSDLGRELLRRDADPYSEGIEDISGCQYIAAELFGLVERHHGRDKARSVFANFAPPGPRRLRELKNLALLDRLDMMKPGPNVQRLAREVIKENGITNPSALLALDKHIRRLRTKRKQRAKRWGWRPRRVTP